jgi:hypothetical protein
MLNLAPYIFAKAKEKPIKEVDRTQLEERFTSNRETSSQLEPSEKM